MGAADWTFFTNSLDQSVLDRGATAGITPPNGGGSYCYGFNSLEIVSGAVALFTDLVNFVPHAKGCKITGAVQRITSGGPIGFSTFLIACAQGPDVSDNAYLLGLSDSNPSKIVLAKGAIITGVPEPVDVQVLRVSDDAVDIDEWAHLRLDVIRQPNDDVVLKVWRNDLGANPVTAPVWAAVDGMADFTDDQLGIATGSQPYTTGRSGFGFAATDVTRRGAVDHFTLARQL